MNSMCEDLLHSASSWFGGTESWNVNQLDCSKYVIMLKVSNIKVWFFLQKFGGLEQLSAGMQGVLITTSDQEKLCVSEAYSLLNEVLTYSRQGLIQDYRSGSSIAGSSGGGNQTCSSTLQYSLYTPLEILGRGNQPQGVGNLSLPTL